MASPKASLTSVMKTPLKSLIPFSACCCSIHSCFFDFPPCFGCQDQSTCLCVRSNSRCCKVASKEETESAKRWCICQEGGTFAVWPRTCLKGQNQCFCFENRCALPCDSDVPCLITMCFVTCFYNYKWQFEVLKSMAEIDPTLVVEETPASSSPHIVQHIHIIQEAPKPQQSEPQNVPQAAVIAAVPAVPSPPPAAPTTPSPLPPAAPPSAPPAVPDASAPPPPPPTAPIAAVPDASAPPPPPSAAAVPMEYVAYPPPPPPAAGPPPPPMPPKHEYE